MDTVVIKSLHGQNETTTNDTIIFSLVASKIMSQVVNAAHFSVKTVNQPRTTGNIATTALHATKSHVAK